MDWRIGNQPKWIAFDAVGTLIFADPPAHLAYHRIGREYGSRARPEEVLHRFRTALLRRSAVTESTTSEAGEHRFWREVVGEVLPDVADPDGCFEELFSHFAQPGSWQCHADVEATLSEAARRGCRLAIASNFDGRLHSLCDGLEPLQLIERRVISSEVGARKPREEFYHSLLDACGCAPGELLMVGDDHDNDVAAPRRLGIPAIHLDRSGAREDAIHSLSDLWSQ